MQTQKTTTPTDIQDKITRALFSPTQWTDGGEPAIDAKMLNRYETTLGGLIGADNNIIQDILNTISTEAAARENADKDINDNINEKITSLTETHKNDIQTFQNYVCWKSFSN